MPSLRPKAKAGQSWLPNQVVYGLDCSDEDPANWKPFGELHDAAEAKKAAESTKATPKSGAGLLPARE